MLAELEEKRSEVEAACRRAGVRRLTVFGSALSDEFDPEHSDVDFIVDFDASGRSPATTDRLGTYLGLHEELEAIFDRPVDLVMAGALKNPYLIASIQANQQVMYDA